MAATGNYDYDPELLDLLALLPDGEFDDVQFARGELAKMIPFINAGVDETGIVIEDRFVPGTSDHPDLAVRVYTPESGTTGDGVLFIHGGGFTVGSLDSEHGRAVLIARDVGAVVVSVDYRLAPEHPAPAALEDCYAALAWMHATGASIGVEPDRIGVLGQSAGGGIAAGLALLTRDRGGPALLFQFLGVPEIDDRLNTTSMQTFVDTPMFNRPSAVSSWSMYLRGASDGEINGDDADVSIYAAPARATDLGGLPPTYISAMEFDPLRDEGIAYGVRLLEAGVSCELHVFPRTFHGSSIVASAAVSQRERTELVSTLRRWFAHTSS